MKAVVSLSTRPSGFDGCAFPLRRDRSLNTYAEDHCPGTGTYPGKHRRAAFPGASFLLDGSGKQSAARRFVCLSVRLVVGRKRCCISLRQFAPVCYIGTVNETASKNAEEFGFHEGDVIQEWLWDDDVSDSIRDRIMTLTGEDLVDEDYGAAVNGVIIWWRDGDDEDALADTIVDAYAVLGGDGPLWVLTPKPGRPGAASSITVQSAATTAGMNAATPLTVSDDWNGIHLTPYGKGR